MKTICNIFPIAMTIFATTGLLQAQEEPKSEPPVGSTPAILSQIDDERAKLEKGLASALKKQIKLIQEKEKAGEISEGRGKRIIADLKASQVAWQSFRSKQCAFLYSYYYEEIGSLGSRAAGIWAYESRLIKQRIEELEEPPNYF